MCSAPRAASGSRQRAPVPAPTMGGLGWGLVHHDPARAARTQAAASESSFWLILKLLFLVIVPSGGRQAAASGWKRPSCRSETGFPSGSEPGKPALPGVGLLAQGARWAVSSVPHRTTLQGPGVRRNGMNTSTHHGKAAHVKILDGVFQLKKPRLFFH